MKRESSLQCLRSGGAWWWKGCYTFLLSSSTRSSRWKGETMKKLSLFGVLLLLLVLPQSADSQYYYGCESDSTRRVVYWSDCECYSCGYTGSGCSVCWDESTGETCYTDGVYCGPFYPTP